MTRDEIRASLEVIARELSTQAIAFEVRRNDTKEFSARGEFSSNIALQLAAKIKAQLQDIAETFETFWPHDAIEIEAHNGFLNFRMSDEILHSSIQNALQQGRAYGASTRLSGTRINVEYVSADPTGPLVLQHARLAATGDALCNLLEFAGASVTREYFLNDSESSSKLKFLGESVAALYEENFGGASEHAAPEGALRDAFTQSVARELVASRGNELLLLPDAERVQLSTHAAREAAVASQKQTLKNFGTHFEVWTSESALRRNQLIESILEKLRAENNAYQKNGTLWLASTRFGDQSDRPLQRENGEYTYLAADIAYHAYRFARNFDMLFNVWTREHEPYVARTRAALRAAGFDDRKLEVVLCSDVRLLRDGEAVEIASGAPSLDGALEEIPAQTLRFLLLLSDADEPTKIETAIRDDESNPAYAAQLLPSRLSTLLRQSEALRQDEAAKPEIQNLKPETEKQLMRLVALWPDEIETATRERKPQRIARFVLEICDATREALSASRPDAMISVDVLRAALVVAQNALRILDIEPREKF